MREGFSQAPPCAGAAVRGSPAGAAGTVRGSSVEAAGTVRGSPAGAARTRRAAVVAGVAVIVASATGPVLPLPLSAQEVLPDQIGVSESPPDSARGWAGNVDFGFTVTEGNSETTTLSIGARATHEARRRKWIFDGSLLRATADGDETANKGDLSGQFDYFPTARFFVFGKAGGSFNQPAGIDLRISPSTGFGYRFVDRSALELSVEGGGTFIREEFVDGTSSEDVFVALANSFRWTVTETTDVRQTLVYNPNTADLGDFLLEGEVSVSTMITGALGLTLSVRDEFDSEPFRDPETGETRERNDVTFVSGITVRF